MYAADIVLSAETAWTYYSASDFGTFVSLAAPHSTCLSCLTRRLATPSWVFNYAPTRFYHIAYNVPASSVTSAVQLAKNRNAAYVYFTDIGTRNAIILWLTP